MEAIEKEMAALERRKDEAKLLLTASKAAVSCMEQMAERRAACSLAPCVP